MLLVPLWIIWCLVSASFGFLKLRSLSLVLVPASAQSCGRRGGKNGNQTKSCKTASNKQVTTSSAFHDPEQFFCFLIGSLSFSGSVAGTCCWSTSVFQDLLLVCLGFVAEDGISFQNMVLLKVILFLNPTSFRPVGDELSMFSRIFLQLFGKFKILHLGIQLKPVLFEGNGGFDVFSSKVFLSLMLLWS